MNTYTVASSNALTKVVPGGKLYYATELTGRIMLGLIFLLSGVGKIGAYAATTAFMEAMGVPAVLLPLVIATEIMGGIAIMVGYRTRAAAFLLAGFTLLAALIFHHHLADQIQMIMFLKNVAIAGAFLLLVIHGAGAWSLDHKSRRQ